MHIFMPMLKDRFIQLLPDHTIDSVLVQKQIFKILYALFQVMAARSWLTSWHSVGLLLRHSDLTLVLPPFLSP